MKKKWRTRSHIVIAPAAQSPSRIWASEACTNKMQADDCGDAGRGAGACLGTGRAWKGTLHWTGKYGGSPEQHCRQAEGSSIRQKSRPLFRTHTFAQHSGTFSLTLAKAATVSLMGRFGLAEVLLQQGFFDT